MLFPNFRPFPILETERLLLRQLTADDAPQVFFLRSDEAVMKYIDRPRAASVADAVDFIKLAETAQRSNDGISWGITVKEKQEVIGYIGFWRMQKENYRAEIGYVLHPSHHRKGIMKEAICKVLDYGFTAMGLHSVEANTNVENKASQSLLESVGFVQEAYFRENYYFNGKFLDSAIYCLLAPA